MNEFLWDYHKEKCNLNENLPQCFILLFWEINDAQILVPLHVLFIFSLRMKFWFLFEFVAFCSFR